MKMGFWVLMVCGLSLHAGAMAPPPTTVLSPEQISYFAGSHQVTSPDGQIPYASGKMVLKRTLIPESGVIIEESRRSGLAGVAGTTFSRLIRVSDTNQFNVQDSNVETGVVTFDGEDPWTSKSWTYEGRLKDGNTVTGVARLAEDALTSMRLVRSAKKTALFKHVEELKPVGASEYRRILLEVTENSPRAEF